jgi:hypothetical protein
MPQMMKAIRPHSLALFCVSAALLSGCAVTGANNQITETLSTVLPSGENVRFGQKAYVDGPIVEPVKLLEDSRCPQNARCVWAGRLKLQMIWHRGNGEQMPFELTLGEPTHIADGNIQITAATPPIIVGGDKLEPADYRFSFRFDGGI